MDSTTANTSENRTLLPGQSLPLGFITATDQSGVLIISTSLGLICAVVSLLIRLFIRVEFSPRLTYDDIVSFLSMVFGTIQSSVVFVGISKGFGKTESEISSTNSIEWQKSLYVSDTFYIVTLWLTKCSVAFFLLRLSLDKPHKIGSRAILASSTVFMVVSVLVIAVRCDYTHPWILANGQCIDLFSRWEAVTVLDILSEAGLFAIALHIIQGLQLPFRKKFVVMLAFGFRLPVIALAIQRLHYLEIEFSSSNPSLDGVPAAVCTQIEQCYAIIATNIACLRPFMSALSTHYGGPMTVKTVSGTNASTSGNQYAMGSLSMTSELRAERDDEPVGSTTRRDGAGYNVAITSGDRRSLHK